MLLNFLAMANIFVTYHMQIIFILSKKSSTKKRPRTKRAERSVYDMFHTYTEEKKDAHR